MTDPNSITAYFDCVVPHLTEKQREVLDVIIYLKSATDEQIADYLKVGINNVSNRVGDLKKIHLIRYTRTINKRYRMVRVSHPNENYKLEATQYQQDKFGLPKTQEPLPIKKVRYYVVQPNGMRKEV